jgi:hypothetical protein
MVFVVILGKRFTLQGSSPGVVMPFGESDIVQHLELYVVPRRFMNKEMRLCYRERAMPCDPWIPFTFSLNIPPIHSGIMLATNMHIGGPWFEYAGMCVFG